MVRRGTCSFRRGCVVYANPSNRYLPPGLINPPGRILAVCVAGNRQPLSPGGGRFSMDTLPGSASTTVSPVDPRQDPVSTPYTAIGPIARHSPPSRESGQPQKTLSTAVILGHQNRGQTGLTWLHAAACEKEWFFSEGLQPFVHHIPVHDAPERIDELPPVVPVIDVVGVLPDIEHHQDLE